MLTRREFALAMPALAASFAPRYRLPHTLTPAEALHLHRQDLLEGHPFLLMAKDWRADPTDDDYEELTADELDDPDFLKDFAHATIELW